MLTQHFYFVEGPGRLNNAIAFDLKFAVGFGELHFSIATVPRSPKNHEFFFVAHFHWPQKNITISHVSCTHWWLLYWMKSSWELKRSKLNSGPKMYSVCLKLFRSRSVKISKRKKQLKQWIYINASNKTLPTLKIKNGQGQGQSYARRSRQKQDDCLDWLILIYIDTSDFFVNISLAYTFIY